MNLERKTYESRIAKTVVTAVLSAARMFRPIVALAFVLISGSAGVRAAESAVNERLVSIQTLAPLIKQVTQSVVSVKAVKLTRQMLPVLDFLMGRFP